MAIFESTAVDLLQCQRDMYAFELGTALECLIADPFDAVRQINIAQTRATVKSAVVNFSERGGQFDAIEVFAFKKGVSPDHGNRISHKNLGQMHTGGEGVRLNHFHAVGNADLL